MTATFVPNSHFGEFRVTGPHPPTNEATPYQVAMDFIRGQFSIEGDFLAAVHRYAKQAPPGIKTWLHGLLVHLNQAPPIAWLHSRHATANDIRFHYDRSNEFYRQFLDSRMIYSCAYFQDPAETLESAQQNKLELICRKLDLRPGDSLLDIGCGWGALLLHAAETRGALATGCTLSIQQWQHVDAAIRERSLGSSVTVRELDYRDMTGSFDKLSSIGMFEHVGQARLGAYFAKMHDLLKRDGLFLNHGIVRRSDAHADSESLFVQRRVFPGTALVTLPEVIVAAERAGFEVLDIENIRPSYALTCRAWVERLQANADACRKLVDDETYRTWLLYLAGSALNFEEGWMDVQQLVLCRRDSHARPLTRAYMFP